MPNFSSIAAPLNKMLKKDEPWRWGVNQQAAVEQLIFLLCSMRVLRRSDYSLPFRLQTNWSQDGVGAVLNERDDQGQEFVVAYANRNCNPAECNYNAYDGESLTVVWAVQYF